MLRGDFDRAEKHIDAAKTAQLDLPQPYEQRARMKMARQLQDGGLMDPGGRINRQKQNTSGGMSASERAKMKKRRKQDRKKGKKAKKRR